MKELISQLMGSPIFLGLSVSLFISYSITTLDKRIIQGKRSGTLPPDHANLPKWVSIFHFLDWGILIAMIVLNWKVALLVWAFFFVLKILPVLETVGNILMAPFKNKGADNDKIL
jgi:hypothetical protein